MQVYMRPDPDRTSISKEELPLLTYVKVRDGEVVETKPLDDGISVDYDAEGKIVGIEFLNSINITADETHRQPLTGPLVI